jgi:hypothetical protein
LAITHSHQLRAELRDVLLRVQLVSGDENLHALSESVLATTRVIHSATTGPAFEAAAQESNTIIRQFIKHAATGIQTVQR